MNPGRSRRAGTSRSHSDMTIWEEHLTRMEVRRQRSVSRVIAASDSRTLGDPARWRITSRTSTCTGGTNWGVPTSRRGQ